MLVKRGEHIMSINSISQFGGSQQTQQRQDPDQLAQQYVNQGKAKDINEAREMLRAQYGDPSQDGSNVQNSDSSSSSSDSSSIFSQQGSGPQKPGDPQSPMGMQGMQGQQGMGGQQMGGQGMGGQQGPGPRMQFCC